ELEQRGRRARRQIMRLPFLACLAPRLRALFLGGALADDFEELLLLGRDEALALGELRLRPLGTLPDIGQLLELAAFERQPVQIAAADEGDVPLVARKAGGRLGLDTADERRALAGDGVLQDDLARVGEDDALLVLRVMAAGRRWGELRLLLRELARIPAFA